MKKKIFRTISIFLSASLILGIAYYWMYTRSFHLYVVGGSTAFGVPYDNHYNPGTIASAFLGYSVNGKPIQVHTIAKGGWTSETDLKMVKKRIWLADAVFLYAGHNEFLSYDHDSRKLLKRTLFDAPIVNENTWAKLLHNYPVNIEKIILLLKARGIPLILATSVPNVKDFEPNRSILGNPLNEPQISGFLQRAEKEIKKNELKSGEGTLKQALLLEPNFAWLHWQLADLYSRQGRFKEAKKHYWKAIDNDGNPVREMSHQIEAVRKLAAQYHVPLVDTVELFEKYSPNSLIGFNLIVDNCHPSFEGYLLLGKALAQEIATLYSTKIAQPEPMITLDESDLFRFHVRHANYFLRMTLLNWNPEARFKRALYHLKEAEKLQWNANLAAQYGIYYSFQERFALAEKYWKEAFQLDPTFTKKRLKMNGVRLLMQRSVKLTQIWNELVSS